MPDILATPINVPTDLESAGGTLLGMADEAVQELELLKQQLAPVLEDWRSQAAALYTDLQVDWNNAADTLFGTDGVLGQISAALNIVWNNYVDCEWANVKGWQRA